MELLRAFLPLITFSAGVALGLFISRRWWHTDQESHRAQLVAERAAGRLEGMGLREEETPDELPDLAEPIQERGHLSLHPGGGQPRLRVVRAPDPLVGLGAAHPDEPPPLDDGPRAA